MGDIICKVCGEPYDYLAFDDDDDDEDFSLKELDFMLKGKGCPSCKGEKPDNAKPYGERMMDWIRSIDENTDLDPFEFL